MHTAELKHWKTYDRQTIRNIAEVVKAAVRPEMRIMIGTDAQRIGRDVHFVTVLILYDPGHGGRVFFTREKILKKMSLWEKLSTETWKSLEAAMMVEEILGSKAQIEVHIDSTDNPKYRSSDYVKQLVGMVVGSGFRSVIKPDAAASSHCADHCVKFLNVPRSQRPSSVSRKKKSAGRKR